SLKGSTLDPDATVLARQGRFRTPATAGPRARREHEHSSSEQRAPEEAQPDSNPEGRGHLDADTEGRRDVARAVCIHDDDRPLARAEVPQQWAFATGDLGRPERFACGPARIDRSRVVDVGDL